MTKKKCNCVDDKITSTDCGLANVKDAYQTAEKETLGYGFYSNVLKKPFERLEDLKRMEEVYFAEQKAKEDKAAQKRADAQKVEDSFKALNAARKVYKEDITQLTKEFSEKLEHLKKAFELGKEDIRNELAAAEEAYSNALKEFTDKYENYHMTLKDGDFETTISSNTTTTNNTKTSDLYSDIFRLIFGI